MRVLTVSRWYPSHDSPGRGSFVRDVVVATVAAGVQARVASFDRVLLYGGQSRQAKSRARAEAAYAGVATPDRLLVAPPSLSAPGVPVARLVTFLPAGEVDFEISVQAHLQALRPFVRALVDQWRPDVIHAHTGLPDGIAATEVGRELGIPVVVTEHSSTVESVLSHPEAVRRYATLLEPDVRLLAVSPSLAERLARLLGVASALIEVLPNPVSVEQFPLPDTANTRRAQDALLYVGSLGEHKGVDVLLKAFAVLQERRPGLRLRIVGGDRKAGDQARLESLATALHIADDVRFDGWLDRAQVANAMADSRVLVHPSPSETFGVVAAEATFSGLPVATRRSGGVPWIVELSGGFGAVARDGSPEAFAAAIGEVLDGPLAVDAREARSRLDAAVGGEVVAKKTLALYEDVIGAAPRRPALAAAEPAAERDVVATSSPRVPTVLVAARRSEAARRVPALPADLRRRLVLVVPPGRGQAAPDGVGELGVGELGVRVVEARRVSAPHPQWWRRGPWARTSRGAAKPPTANQLLGRAVLRAATTVRTRGEPVEVVALDAAGAALVGRLDTAQVRLAPGSARWLADRWDAEGQDRVNQVSMAPEATYDAQAYWSGLHTRQDLSAVGQAGLPSQLNTWLYRALAGTISRFVRRRGLLAGVDAAFDVGAGSGYWVRVWHDLGVPRVDGCDLVAEAVARLEDELSARGDRFTTADIGADDSGLPDVQYGFVSVMNVLLHLTDDQAFGHALANVARLVRPGGHLLLVEPALLDASYERPVKAGQHSRARPLAAYRDPLLAAGLELVTVRGAVAYANNPIEGRTPAAYRRYRRWWAWVARTSKTQPARVAAVGPLMLGLDRLALLGGAAPSSKIVLLRRPG